MDASSNPRSEIDPREVQDMEPHFRAIRIGSTRRGIRLEQIYWATLQEIADHHRMTLAEYVTQVAERYSDAVNITSVLRVLATRWLKERMSGLREVANAVRVESLVQACPSPAFVLTADKRIIAYNPAFLNYLQTRVRTLTQLLAVKRLHFSLDMQISELIDHLRQSGKPLRTGFVLGIDDQRVRGHFSAVLATRQGQTVILCYVLQG